MHTCEKESVSGEASNPPPIVCCHAGSMHNAFSPSATRRKKDEGGRRAHTSIHKHTNSLGVEVNGLEKVVSLVSSIGLLLERQSTSVSHTQIEE